MKFLVSRSFLAPMLALAAFGTSACIPQPKDKTEFTGVDSTDPVVNDIQINRAIRERIAADLTLSSQNVTVASTDGVVTVNGSVDNLPSKDKVLRIAGAIRGVRAVVDEAAVKPVSRPDHLILGDVERALQSDPATEKDVIKVTVDNGVVTLKGQVDSWQEKQLLTGVAMAVSGVKQIDNAVVVNRDLTAKRTDAEIASAVKQRLGFDIWLNGSLVDANVKDGVVTLSGVVASPELKNRAIADAQVTGVVGVAEEGLVINWWSQTRNRRANEFQVRTDPEIAQAVRDAFLYDARLKVHAPDVSVQNGEVMLAGQLDNMPARLAAEEDAGNTVGVNNVIDEVVVVPGVDVSDADVERSAKAAIARDRLGRPNEVSFSSNAGKLTVRGSVRTPEEAREVMTAMATVPGVTGIVNELQVRPSVVPPTPAALKLAVETRLFLDPRVDFQRVNVTVDADRTVILNGTVDNAQEVRVAREAAIDVGAPRVQSELQVRDYAPITAPQPQNPGGLRYPWPLTNHP